MRKAYRILRGSMSREEMVGLLVILVPISLGLVFFAYKRPRHYGLLAMLVCGALLALMLLAGIVNFAVWRTREIVASDRPSESRESIPCHLTCFSQTDAALDKSAG